MFRGIEDSRGRLRSVFPVASSWVNDPVGPPPAAAGAGWAPWTLGFVSFALVVVAPMLPKAIQMFGWAFAMILASMSVMLFLISPRRVAGAYPAFSALLASGYCPACAYRIDDIRPEHDGCTACPECGAAWRR